MDYLLFLSSIMFFAVSMCFTPGPNNAMVMAIGLEKGFKAAVPFCVGASVGANATLLLLGFGLGEVFTRFPVVYEVLRYVGAAYMLWLAWRISGLRLPFWHSGSGAKSGDGSTGKDAALKNGKDTAPDSGSSERGAAAVPGEAGGTGETGETDKAGASARDETGASARGETGASARPFTFFQAFFFQLLNVKVWLTNVIIVNSYVGTGDDMWTRLWFCVLLFTVLGTGAMCTWAAGGMFMRRFLTSGGMRRANYVFGAFLLLSIILLFV